MNPTPPLQSSQRRQFLRLAAGLPLAWGAVNASLAFAQSDQPLNRDGAANYGNLLILVELKGANDGLNTVVPYSQARYRELRPKIAIDSDKLLKISDHEGLHPALEGLHALWKKNQLAIVQGVGYKEPNLSHFRSIEIWDTASRADQYLDDGWLTRAFELAPPPASFAADGVVVASSAMGPLAGHGARAVALANPQEFLRQAKLARASASSGNSALAHLLKVERDVTESARKLAGTHEFKTEFPKHAFGQIVRTAALMAANKNGVAVLRLSHGSFDTHAGQPGTHQRLLTELNEGLVALQSALTELGRWDKSLIMTYSEFGRRPKENQSAGTDHGTIAPHFVLGGQVKGGLYGDAPQLDRLDGSGNLAYAVDFRSLYQSALSGWWGLSATACERVLGGKFDRIDFLRA